MAPEAEPTRDEKGVRSPPPPPPCLRAGIAARRQRRHFRGRPTPGRAPRRCGEGHEGEGHEGEGEGKANRASLSLEVAYFSNKTA